MLQKSFFHCKQSAILFFLLVTCFVTIGQNPFIAGTTTDISTSLNQSTTNLETANDVWAENNCANFKVWANEYGCSWSFVDACPHITQTGVSALVASQAISNPDVAIVVDHPVSGDVYYALFVYYNTSDGKFYFDPWYVDASGVLLPVGSPQILEASNVPPNPSENAIRIDANKNGNFVIVFDNRQTGTLKMIAGRIDPGTGPYLSTAGTDNGKSVIPRTSQCIMPDVAIEESSEEGTAGVYYIYLSDDYSTLVVGYQGFADIWNASPGSYADVAKRDCSPSDESFGRPRIAAPGDITYNQDWTVVWRTTFSTGTTDIVGLTNHYGVGLVDHNYTDNSEYQFVYYNITVAATNTQDYPAVSYGYYDHVGKVAQITWKGAWLDPYPDGTGGDYEIIALSLDEKGAVAPYCTGYPAFKIVPKSAGAPNYVNFPSMAGRHTYYTEAMNVCWSDVSYPNVFEKDFNWCDANYRVAAGKNNTASTLINDKKQTAGAMLYPNPSDKAVKLNFTSLDPSKIYVLTINGIDGKRNASFSGSPLNIQQVGEKFIGSLKAGVYILTVSNNDKVVVTKKIVRF